MKKKIREISNRYIKYIRRQLAEVYVNINVQEIGIFYIF